MKIDAEWLDKKDACEEGKEWFLDAEITDPVDGIKNLIKHDKLDWANWLIVRVMERPQYLAYAIFAAEQVIEIYEKKYPEDARPRNAIETAKAVLENDTPAARDAGDAAGDAAGAAAWDAALAAAGAAALALVVRDLIGEQFYDTLTGPLRSIGITVHPADAPYAEMVSA